MFHTISRCDHEFSIIVGYRDIMFVEGRVVLGVIYKLRHAGVGEGGSLIAGCCVTLKYGEGWSKSQKA